MTYSFNTAAAAQYGVEEAVFLHNLYFWTEQNRAAGRNLHDGDVWTYNSIEAYAAVFGFWTVSQIRRIVRNLIQQGALKAARYGSACNNTTWYALTPAAYAFYAHCVNEQATCANQQTDLLKQANPFVKTDKPITDSKPDTKPDTKQHLQASAPVAQYAAVRLDSQPTVADVTQAADDDALVFLEETKTQSRAVHAQTQVAQQGTAAYTAKATACNSHPTAAHPLWQSGGVAEMAAVAHTAKYSGSGAAAPASKPSCTANMQQTLHTPQKAGTAAQAHAAPQADNQAAARCAGCYTENFGKASAYIKRRINHWLQQGLTAGLICAAIERASGANARGWNYIDAILQRCHRSGITTQQAYFAQKYGGVPQVTSAKGTPANSIMRQNINKILTFA